MGSMLLMGTSSLVLATETVIGEYSAEAVDMTNAVVQQCGHRISEITLRELIGFEQLS